VLLNQGAGDYPGMQRGAEPTMTFECSIRGGSRPVYAMAGGA